MMTRRSIIRSAVGAGFAATASGAFATARRDDVVTVLTFNIYLGGAKLGPLERTAQLIRESGADLVGVQEVGESATKLAELTGLHCHTQDARGSARCIFSRFPILENTPQKWGVKVDVPVHGPLWVFNVHLAYKPYQPYQLAGIEYANAPFVETAAEAIAEALAARAGQVASLLKDASPAIRAKEPMVLTGDFNEPSHLDWTERAAKAGRCALPVVWPTSRALVDAGFTDAYRTIHPNEVEKPGHTWTPTPGKREVHDRIDMIYCRNVKPVRAAVIGESEEKADIMFSPYPSDHRCVVAGFEFA